MKTKIRKYGLIAIAIILISIIAISLLKYSEKISIANLDAKTLRTMEYDVLTDDEEYVDNCNNNIKFSAFFTQDLDGDGDAEKILGSCNEIGSTDTLYMDLNVLSEGYLKDGKITIDSKNFTYSMQMVKDTVLKNNYVSSNVTSIELNDVYAGTQELIMGTINSYITSQSSYTAINSITLTGTYVNEDEEEYEISKTIDLTIDWYGTAKAKISTSSSTYDYSEYVSSSTKVLDDEAKKIEFTVPSGTYYVEMTDLYGYYPISVSCDLSESYWTYDEDSNVLYINDTSSSSDYTITLIYPDYVYEEIINNGEVELAMSYYYGSSWADLTITYGLSGYVLDESDVESTEIDDEAKELEFSFTISEKTGELIVSNQNIEIEIPSLCDYYPTTVSLNISDSYYSYDEETHILSIDRSTTSSSSTYTVTLVYPDEAYEELLENVDEKNIYTIVANISGYLTCYNNENEEFENPYVTDTVSNTASITIKLYGDSNAGHTLSVSILNATYISYPTKQYVISKQELLDAYDTEDETSNMQYTVCWGCTRTDVSTSKTTLIFKDGLSGGDLFDSYYLKDYVSNVGIYFYDSGLLPDDATVYIYNDETNELIKEFTNGEWKNYTSSNPYYYDEGINDIRIETSEDKQVNASLYIYNIREIDISKLKENFTREDIEEISKLTTTLTGSGSNISNTITGDYSVNLVTAKSYSTISITPNYIATSEIDGVNEIITISTKSANAAYANWQNGVFLVKIPSKIIYMKLNGISISNSSVNLDGYELYKENGQYFIKIITSNEDPTSGFSIIINCDMLADPMSNSTTQYVGLYAYNEYWETYYNSTSDIYDLDADEIVSDKVEYETAKLMIEAPSTFVTAETVSDYNDEGEITVAPNIAEVTKDTREATINIEFANNYTNTVSDIEILGKIPFEGNTYINGTSLNSEFSVTMKNGGITVPSSLKNGTTIYYSENEDPTNDLDDESNGWTLAEDVTSFDNIKTYLIIIDTDLVTVSRGTTYEFSYTVTIPEDITVNFVSYACHIVYFDLNTDGGKLSTAVQPNKVGMRITRYYDIEIMKYKANTNLGVQGAKYQLSWYNEDGDEEYKIITSTSEGKLALEDLRVNEIYTFKEIKAPDNYEINENILEFYVTENSNGELEFVILSDTNFDGETTIEQDLDGNDILKSYVYDTPKFAINITKTDSTTGDKLSGVIFQIDDKMYITTSGEITIDGLSLNTEYTLKEISADGYYLNEDITFKLTSDEQGNITVESDSEYFINGTVSNNNTSDLVELDVNIQNEKIPTYNVTIQKIEENSEETLLQGAKFLLTKESENSNEYYTTDENGTIEIYDLYQYVEGKNITGRYILQEVEEPSGYVLNKEQIAFVVTKNEDGELEISIENESELDTLYSVEIEDEENLKIIIQDKSLFKVTKIDEETGATLANVEFIIYELDGEDGTILDYAKDANGEYIGTQNENGDYVVITDENGTLTAPLKNGYYKMVEVTFPEGYEEKQNVEVFQITSNKETTEYDVEIPEIPEIPTLEIEDDTTEVLEIECIEDLIDFQIAVNSGKNYYSDTTVKLTRDLDFEDENSYRNANDTSYGDLNGDGEVTGIKDELTDENGIGFTPIGTDSTNCFEGIFDGQGCELRNIYINNGYAAGLFGYINVLKIKDFGITGEIKTSGGAAGSICGDVYNYANVVNCYSECNIESNSAYVGGLIGRISGNDENGSTTFIKDSYNTGNIQGTYEVGGIVGYAGYYSKYYIDSFYVVNCYNKGKIDGSEYVAGIIGYTNYVEELYIKDCYNEGETISAKYGDVGGIIGRTYGDIKEYFVNCYNSATITGEKNCYNLGGLTGMNDSDESIYYNCYNNGGIYVNDGSHNHGGIVGNCNGTLTMYKCNNTGDIISLARCSIGGIVGRSNDYTNIIDCYNTGNIEAYDVSPSWGVGGIIGDAYSKSDVIINCYNTGNITTDATEVGGIVGRCYYSITIYGCFNIGNLTIEATSSTPYTGGILSGGNVSIEECYNIGNITVSSNNGAYVGGLVSNSSSCISKSCYNSGNLTVETATYAYVGGLISCSNGDGTISYCYNTGNINVTSGDTNSAEIGGLIGYTFANMTISYSYNTGNIEASGGYVYMSGLIGIVSTSNTIGISYCYNTGDIECLSGRRSHYRYFIWCNKHSTLL